MQRAPGGRIGRRPSPPAEPGRWIVTLPAWGDRCVDVLIRATLPAVVEACDAAGVEYELLIWTDQGERVVAAMPSGVRHRLLEVPRPDGAFESLSNCHRFALRNARIEDRVLLLTADMVVSREVVATCEAHVRAGRQLVCCCAMRALDGPPVPVGAPGRELLAWGWENRHRMTRECTWPDGRSYDVWRMYFERGEEVAARVILPHPLAVAPRGRQLEFRPTIDVNLAMSFAAGTTHMITHPEEGAVVELSPPDKDFLLTTPMIERYHHRGPSVPELIRQTNTRHRMFWGKRVVIRGTGGDCGDEMLVRRILG